MERAVTAARDSVDAPSSAKTDKPAPGMTRLAGWGQSTRTDSVYREPELEGQVAATIDRAGTIARGLGRSYGDRRVMDVYDDEEKGKWSVTHYKVLERMGYVTLIECQLETGRTHQIRAHMKHIGHPLFSDAMYGGDKILKGTVFSKYRQFVENCFELMPRQALHARSLGFVHPSTKKNIYFESALPQDFESVLKKWRNYTAATADQNL